MNPHHKLLVLPEIRDSRGLLTFAEGANLPFDVKRIFVIYGLADGTKRGGHAHRLQHQLVFMMNGRAKITVDDGHSRDDVLLSRPNQALYVPAMRWLELSHFTAGAVCAVLTSDVYDESDYIRDSGEFLQLATR